MITAATKAAFLDDGVPGILRLAGGSLRAMLFVGGVEVSGGGYARQSTDDVAAAQNNVLLKIAYVDVGPVTFTATGAGFSYDEIRIYNRAGSVLLMSLWAGGPRAVETGEPHQMTIRFEIPTGGTSVGVIDLRDFDARANNDDFDNKPAILTAMAQSFSVEGGKVVIPAGDWCIGDTPFDLSTLPAGAYDQFYLCGVAPEFTHQHQEESGVADLANTFYSRLKSFAPAGSVVMDLDRPTRFGAIRLENLTFRAENQVEAFIRIGDNTASASDYISLRGLWIDGCYFTCLGSHSPWLVDSGAAGLTRNPAFGSAIDITGGYDVCITRTAFRNWGRTGILARHLDGGIVRDCISFLCPLVEGVFIGTNSYVPLKIMGCWSEITMDFGIRAPAMQVSDYRSEAGYTTGLTPQLGPKALPSTVGWSVAVGASTVVFTGFQTGFDCSDYFKVGDVIELTPQESTESTVPPRLLHISAVGTSTVTFSRADSFCYVSRAISGNGAALRRMYGLGAVFEGDNCYLNGFSIGVNSTQECPQYAVLPSTSVIRVTSDAEPFKPNDLSRPIVIASSAGDQGLWGGVSTDYRRNAPDHPLADVNDPPGYFANWRPPIYYPDSRTQLFIPGHGVGGWGGNARELTFHRIWDAELGQYVWCYRLSDSAFGWKCRPLRRAGVALTYDIRYYVSTGTPNLSIGCEGAAAASVVALSTGWGNITGSIAANQLALDSHGSFLRLYTVPNVFIGPVKVVQAG